MSDRHYSYGSGMTGCLYDNGPYFAETASDAIKSVLLPFIDVLLEDSRRAGADYCEITELTGPCPENDQ